MKTIHRRNFLQGASAGLLLVSFQFSELAHAAVTTLSPAKSVAKDALDTWLTIDASNQVTVYVGKVDLGTGTKTALSQIAAEELSIPFDKVTMVMGDTATTPDQWLTGAALTIQQGGAELRIAAASARQALLQRAAQRWNVPVSALQVTNGVVTDTSNPSRQAKYGELIGRAFKSRWIRRLL